MNLHSCWGPAKTSLSHTPPAKKCNKHNRAFHRHSTHLITWAIARNLKSSRTETGSQQQVPVVFYNCGFCSVDRLIFWGEPLKRRRLASDPIRPNYSPFSVGTNLSRLERSPFKNITICKQVAGVGKISSSPAEIQRKRSGETWMEVIRGIPMQNIIEAIRCKHTGGSFPRVWLSWWNPAKLSSEQKICAHSFDFVNPFLFASEGNERNDPIAFQ